MNPDSYRDAMDRCSNPYEGSNQDAMKVTTGLDELSLKKQLPLRQQANRPMFKYNTSRTQQSVHLFSQGDVGLVGRESAGVINYGSTGMYYTGNVTPAHQMISNDNLNNKIPQTQRTAMRRISNASNSSTSSNPYVRPVSATEVAANINGEKARKMVEGAIDVVSDKTSSDLANQSLQRNSFLGPLSGIGGGHKDKVITKKQSEPPSQTPPPPAQTNRPTSSGSESSFKQYNESKANMKSKFQFASTASTPAGTPLVLKPDTNKERDNRDKTADTSTVKKLVRNSTTADVPQTAGISENKQSLQTKDNISSKKTDTYAQFIAQPLGSSRKSNRDQSNVTRQDASKVASKLDAQTNGKPASDPPPREVDVSFKKMPVTNTLTGTMYYRKASMTESNISKHSPHNLQNSSSSVKHNQDPPHKTTSESTAKVQSESTTNLDSSRSSLSQVSNKPPRPTLERSNASIQFTAKLSSQTKKLSNSQTSLDKTGSGDEKQVHGKPPHGKISSRGDTGDVRGQLDNRGGHPSDTRGHLSSRSLPGKPTLAGIKAKQKPEQRPKADGAPAKTVKSVEKKRAVTAKQIPANWDDEVDEEGVDESDDPDNEDDDESEATPSGERLPGDGEASFEDFDDEDDDDALDNFEGSVSDGESDGYSINSRSSADRRSVGRPLTSQSAGAPEKPDEFLEDKSKARPATASNVVVKPPFKLSLFKNIPPTLNFVGDGEKTEQLPWELRKLLKWKMSPITPIVVKRAIGRVGFRISKRNHDWLGCFGKHMKAQCFKSLREYQKLNHFPGSFQIGRKDRLWRNLSRMQVHHGKREFNFFPHTFVLPADLRLLKRAWEDGNSKQKWIIKPPASARGIGIRVIGKWSQIPRRKPVIVQKYLARPYLINDSKFDMRIYVYVSSYDPLRIYVYEDGLARFASCKYSSSMKSLNNRYMHLTNYSVNKKNAEYCSNTDATVSQGHKWSLKALWNFMKRQGHNTTAIWDSIRDLIIKTIICGDCPINSMTKSNSKSRYVCHELFGFDILLDENMKPWILEVNISPSLHSNSQLDISIKGGMIKDLMNIAGFRIPDERDVTSSGSNADFSAHNPLNKFCMDKRLFTNSLAPDERAKHAYYCQKHQDEQIMQSILDIITPDDMRLLTESIDEDGRKGNFQRLFPTPHTHRYLRFFEQPRYYNLLLDQWVMRYNRMEQRGILLLQSFCDEKIHLENPTSNTRHQWAPPNSTMATLRAVETRPSGTMNSARGKVLPVFKKSQPSDIIYELPPRSAWT